MARRKKKKAKKRNQRQINRFFLTPETQKYIFGIIFFLFAIISGLSFFEKAGIAGSVFFKSSFFLIGKTIFLLPLIFTLSTLAFFRSTYKRVLQPLILTIIISICGISGFLEGLKPGVREGGFLGYILTFPLLSLFGFLVTQVIFFLAIVAGAIIFWNLLKQPASEEIEAGQPSFTKIAETKERKQSFIKKIFSPSFKIKSLESPPVLKREEETPMESSLKLRVRPVKSSAKEQEYELPPLELLEKSKGQPLAGDVKTNSIIIKKALESFEIPVEMSGVSIGPTVTQYSLKPADGIKLSRIISLSNDLALALAIHPIRIEAPIPGKSLVGIEVPNKGRALVRLRELIQNQAFQTHHSGLAFPLGKDVSGSPVYADLGRMPHLLVAGSTGTGKTIFLNTLILSLVYKNSPKDLKLILIDPKRVEFTVYGGLPHLLCPAIVDSPRAVNALKWLIEEMERRFKLLAEIKSRNIYSYNEKVKKNGEEHLAYIVLVIDELADLMAAKGRDVETSIVRLAQMSRAVGIHLVVATQRPSVEVITGLIKANITSRITFQVASQVDSRTVLDMAGAEKLLGAGDMLFISSEIIRPKRIQAAYVSEKEVKKVVDWVVKSEESKEESFEEDDLKGSLFEALERNLEVEKERFDGGHSFQEDSLYKDARKVIIQYKKASASLLQRRLRIGYARAARLIDTFEERGEIGPSQGAKPREVYISNANEEYSQENELKEEDKDDGWQSI